MNFFIDLSQMRCSVRCAQCNDAIKPEWKVCPKCKSSVDDKSNLTLDVLRQNISQDVADFLARDSIYKGSEFIMEASEKCLFDWEWGHVLEWAEGHWLLGSCYSDYQCHTIRIPDTTGEVQGEICEAKAVELYRLAALKGFAPAENDYGYCLLQGRGNLKKNPTEAFRFVEKAAKHGYLSAVFNLSSLYRFGHGVPKDEARALQIHFQVAEQGFAPAQEMLGTLYRLGRDGIARDLALAMQWYRKASEQGYAEAMFGLGCLYYNGEGVPKNKAEARKWFREAANRNHMESQRIIEREEIKFFPWTF
jgi:TPR repeat protein